MQHPDNSFKFTYVGADDNGGAIQGGMVPIFSYLDNDTFTGEYVGDGLEPLVASSVKSGQIFRSQGILQNKALSELG